MSPRVTVGVVVATLVAIAGVSWGVARQEIHFPHRDHADLFPVCTGCHQGIDTGETAELYPEPADCRRCHDGSRVEQVAWTGPDRQPSNLDFDHTAHAEYTERTGDLDRCRSCHFESDDEEWMSVVHARPERCTQCHAHEADGHLAEAAVCRDCHVPLTGAPALAEARIATFPKPASHEAPDFLLGHGVGADEAEARCAVCHARETCARCHANAEAVPAIAALGPDPRVASLESGKEPEYPEPESHRTGEWLAAHGARASEDAAECASCHTAPSCRSCHLRVETGSAIASLPRPGPDDARGVPGERMARAVHPIGFETDHGSVAAAEQDRCATCHAEEEFCSSCHDSPASSGFHPPNFLARHGDDSWTGSAECSTCHNTEAFCRACHQDAGLAARGRLDLAYHNREPLWLLAHGQAARQQLESCTTCHTQNDCARCHSAASGWNVNPHGPDFDPERAADANPLTCRRCHIGDPLATPPPPD